MNGLVLQHVPDGSDPEIGRNFRRIADWARAYPNVMFGEGAPGPDVPRGFYVDESVDPPDVYVVV